MAGFKMDSETFFAKKYNVPPEIFEQVKKMYNVVLLTKAYYTNNKKLADKSYKKLKKYRKLNYILMYYGIKIHLIKPFIEILRRLRSAYYILTVFISGKKI